MKQYKHLNRTLIIPLLIIALAIFGATQLSRMKQRPPQSAPQTTAAVPAVVKTFSAQLTTIPLEGYGTLQAREEISIVPEVSGKVIKTHPQLEVGLEVLQGELLFSVVDEEYKHRLTIEAANLAKAEFDLKEEQGRGLVAQREWKLLDQRLKESALSKELALRKAHEQQKIAAVAGAKGSLRLAKLNVSRAQVISPCNGVVIEEQVGLGQFVNAGTTIAKIACTDELKLIISLPPNNLQWLTPTEPTIENANADIEGHPARLIRLLSSVDQQTRMIRLLFQLPGTALKPTNTGLKPLLLGTFSKVTFTAATNQLLFTIPEENIRNNNEIWLLENDTLKIQRVQLVYRHNNNAMIQVTGNPDKIQMITSYINAPYAGMPLKVTALKTPTSGAPEPSSPHTPVSESKGI